MTSKLTLNLGLRWEVFGSPSEVKGRLSNIILGSGSTIFQQIANGSAGRVSQRFERGLIVLTAGTWGNVIRLLVPLVTTDEQVREGLSVLEAAIASVVSERSEKVAIG